MTIVEQLREHALYGEFCGVPKSPARAVLYRHWPENHWLDDVGIRMLCLFISWSLE